jgi:MSHA biogenesis protein MshQ
MSAPAGVQTNYLLEVMLGPSDLPNYTWSGLDADLRVVDQDDKTALSFFVQPRSASTQVVRLWVLFPSLPASTRTIYVYYGNSSATSASSGTTALAKASSGVRLWTRSYGGSAFSSEAEYYTSWNASKDNVSGYGCTIANSFNGQNNASLFGSGTNIGWNYTTILYVAPSQAGTWQFRWGPDLGLGGGLFVDDVPLQQKWGSDLWWSSSWNPASQILQGSVTLAAGYHVVRGLGDEGCCDGGQELDAMAPGGSWNALGTPKYSAQGPSCQVSLATAQTPQSRSTSGASCSMPASFQIRYSNYGLYCLNQTVTLTALDSTGNPYTTYTGTVTLTTTTGRGTWTLTSGGGTLSDPTPDDGQASYTFPGGQSSATFALAYRAGASPVTVNATQSTPTLISDDGTQGSIAFSPSGFTVTSAPFSNPAGGVPAFASPQTAGTSFNVYLTAYGQSPTDATCGIITTYAGAKSLKFWSTYVNPASGTLRAAVNGTSVATAEASAAAQSVTFSGGQAIVVANYKDAGSLSLSMKDDSTGNPGLPTGIRGSTGTFVSRPANFVVSGIRRTSDGFANPAAGTANGTVFIAAGQAFTATVTAVESGGAATPNFGRESPAESVRFDVSLVVPTSGHAPSVSGTVSGFTGGVATGTALSWPEVGVVNLIPRVADGSYLASGDVVGSASGNVGRFIPNAFATALNTPVLGTACTAGGFSYVGQALTYTVAPVLTVTAQALGGATTQNYTGSLFKLTNATLTGRAYGASPASPALDTSGLPATSADPAIADLGTGSGTLTFSAGSGLAFSHASVVAPFSANITLAINVIDGDGVAAANPVTFGSGSGIAFSAGNAQRYGRLAIRNAAGSELLDLPVSLTTQYYLGSGQGFATNTADSCTVAPAISFSNYQLNLSAGETCVRDSGNPGVSGLGCATAAGSRYRATAVAGDFNLILAAPGAGNSGALSVTASAPVWLRFPWNQSSGTQTSPTGIATFGVFPGPASRVHEREVY